MSEALDTEALDRLRAKYGSTQDLAPVTEIKPKTGPTPPPVPPVPPVLPVSEEAPALAEVLEEVVAWYGEFIFLENPGDYEILALFTAHTRLIDLQRTTPRLLLDSPVPESGKTTLLEHLERLCLQDPKPAKMGNSVTVAVLARLLRQGPRLLLLDEADRSLSPKNPGTEDRLGILNTGYKKGGEHYINVPGAGRDWEPEPIPTFAPVVIAGNTPLLPDDTRGRCIEINLMPDPYGEIRDSDWEEIEEEADRLRDRLALAIEANRHRFDEVRQVSLPPGCRARNKERWRPLKQVAALAGNGWEEKTDRLIEAEMERKAAAKESGDRAARYWVTLLEHLSEYYRERPGFGPTDSLVPWLVAHNPETWGEESPFGRALTPQRLGRIVSERYKITSQRPDKARGYHENQFLNAWQSLGIRAPNNKPAKPEEPAKPAGETNPLCPTHGKPTLGGLCGRCEAEE